MALVLSLDVALSSSLNNDYYHKWSSSAAFLTCERNIANNHCDYWYSDLSAFMHKIVLTNIM